jgi:hypothetical protein
MKSLVLVAVAATLLVLPASADGGPGGPPTFHDHDTFTDVDPNFCGTGTAIDVAGRFNALVWIGETGGDPDQDLKVTFNFSATLTNPANGAAVIDSGAGSFTNEIVAGLESGAHRHVFVENGLRAKLKLANGRVLTRDAGKLVYSISSDENDNVIDFEILAVHGPHEAFQTDVWCDAAIEALGID